MPELAWLLGGAGFLYLFRSWVTRRVMGPSYGPSSKASRARVRDLSAPMDLNQARRAATFERIQAGRREITLSSVENDKTYSKIQIRSRKIG